MPSSKPSSFMTWRCGFDPNFALAWARLSGAHALLYSNRRDTTIARRDAVKSSFGKCAETATELARNATLTGYYQYWVLARLRVGQSDLRTRQQKITGKQRGLICPCSNLREARDIGNESVAYWERGLALNPRNRALLTEGAFTYAALRQFPESRKALRSGTEYPPNSYLSWH